MPRLDQVLGGGLPEFSFNFNLTAGPIDCGKTTLAHHWQAATFLTGEHFIESDPNQGFTVADGPTRLRQSVQRTADPHRRVDADALAPAELVRMQQIIEYAVVHMHRLVGDPLGLSRVRTGKLRLVEQAIDLREIVLEAIDACRPAISARLQTRALPAPPGPHTRRRRGLGRFFTHTQAKVIHFPEAGSSPCRLRTIPILRSSRSSSRSQA
ncbi:hypothetical protein ACFQGW_11125 [Xanthomonas theicola]|uniref:hypothetical protein n=1 Tax=Xanthomonas theicola TaxID=56464 RepID=UPI003607C162